MTTYYDDGQVRFLLGDVREMLRSLPADSVHCVVTSPPYYGLRDYGIAGQIGLEPSLGEYITVMVETFREVRRVLRDDGTLWLNIGDSYANDGKWGGSTGGKHVASLHGATGVGRQKVFTGLKPKDLLMVPARLALALQADGWLVRSAIVWSKASCMPEAVQDRPTNSHEMIYLLTRNGRYFYDSLAVRQPGNPKQDEHNQRYAKVYETFDAHSTSKKPGAPNSAGIHSRPGIGGANLRSVWHLGPEPFPEAHFATFPTEIPRRAILAGTSDHGVCAACSAPWRRLVEVGDLRKTGASGNRRVTVGGKVNGGDPAARATGLYASGFVSGFSRERSTAGWEPSCSCDVGEPIAATVLDPFLGSGTTALVAKQLGRRAIGIDLNPEYLDLAVKRCRQLALMPA